MTELLSQQVDLAVKLLQELNSNDDVVFSPALISLALATVHDGTKGQTSSQLEQALFNGVTDTAKYNSDLKKSLNPTEKPNELRSVNQLYCRKDLQLQEPFKKVVSDQSSLEQADFSDPDKVTADINSKVAAETKDKIKNLMAPGLVPIATELIAVNAAYFKGTWEIKFPRDETKDCQFYVSENKTKNVNMMKHYRVGSDCPYYFGYHETELYYAAKFDYKGENINMLILLPKDRFGLKKIVANLTTSSLTEAIEKTRKDKKWLHVQLPRFKLESEGVDLSKQLTKPGITNLFMQGKADLGGMDGSKLAVSGLIHKTCIEVNEEGMEDGAGDWHNCYSALAWIPKEPCKDFIVDHPFMLCILHGDAIIFCGTVSDPSSCAETDKAPLKKDPPINCCCCCCACCCQTGRCYRKSKENEKKKKKCCKSCSLQ